MIETIKQRLRRLAHRPLLLAILTLSLLLLVLGTIYASRYFTARARLNAAIAAARANGEPVWFSELDPGPERNPSEDARKLLELCQEIVLTKEDDSIISKADRIVRNDNKDEFKEMTEEDYQRLEEITAANADLLTQITEVAGRGGCWFEYDYETPSPWHGQTRHSKLLARVESLLNAAAFDALQSKDEKRAFKTVMGYFNFVEVCQNEPLGVLSPYHYQSLGLYFRGILLIQSWSKVTPWSLDSAKKLESRLIEIESAHGMISHVLNSRSNALTTMSNLGNEDNQESLRFLLEAPETPKWLEELLPGSALQRQLNRWNSFAFRPWVMDQQAFAINVSGRQARWADEIGPHATQQMKALDEEIENVALDMPLCKALIFTHSADHTLALSLRQSFLNGVILLRLSQTLGGQSVDSDRLVTGLEAAIQAAPVGYLSGEPVQYRIEGPTVTLYDVRPSDKEEFGHFSLQLLHSSDGETDEASEETAAP